MKKKTASLFGVAVSWARAGPRCFQFRNSSPLRAASQMSFTQVS